MIKVKSFVFNPFMENTYVLSNERGEAMIIDPGCYEKGEEALLMDYIGKEELKVKKLINTHCHIDHVLGNEFIKNQYKVELGIHDMDQDTLRSVKVYAPNYGFQFYKESKVDYFIKEGEIIRLGEDEFEVLFIPGHAPGHIVLYMKEQGFCIGGDVLFKGSIGRTDLPGGDFDQLIENIRTKMFALPDDTIIYSGHGENTTIGFEKLHNPFLRSADV